MSFVQFCLNFLCASLLRTVPDFSVKIYTGTLVSVLPCVFCVAFIPVTTTSPLTWPQLCQKSWWGTWPPGLRDICEPNGSSRQDTGVRSPALLISPTGAVVPARTKDLRLALKHWGSTAQQETTIKYWSPSQEKPSSMNKRGEKSALAGLESSAVKILVFLWCLSPCLSLCASVSALLCFSPQCLTFCRFFTSASFSLPIYSAS